MDKNWSKEIIQMGWKTESKWTRNESKCVRNDFWEQRKETFGYLQRKLCLFCAVFFKVTLKQKCVFLGNCAPSFLFWKLSCKVMMSLEIWSTVIRKLKKERRWNHPQKIVSLLTLENIKVCLILDEIW